MPTGDKFVLDKGVLLKALENMSKKIPVVGPTLMADGEVTFEPLTSFKKLTFDYVNDFDPLKRFFTPAKENLFSFTLDGRKPRLKPMDEVETMILFGVRSCDVQGFAHMDKFFSGAYYDDCYWRRRNNTTVISMACNKPLPTCFCICCNGGPWLESGFDLQLTDFGDRFLVDVGSKKGKKLLNDLKMKLQKATAKDEEKRKQLMQACDAQMQPTAYLAKACIMISNNRVNEKLWDEMGDECFSCGGCTHVCPCCTCFDVQDCMLDENKGVRFRCWDSCQYAGFTHEASGHNPRAKAKERVKRRFYHKLSYAYIQQDGHPGCVGCGRCITVCQAFNLLDISAVVKRLRREGQIEAVKGEK